MNDDIKLEIRNARERKANFSPEQMKEHLTEQFSQMVARDMTNESIARIKLISIQQDVSISKAIGIEVQRQVDERVKREESRFQTTAERILESLKPIAEENERMRHELNLVFWIGCKNASIPDDAFAPCDCIIIENEVLHQLLPLAGCIQNLQVKAGKSILKTGGE